MHLIIHDAVVLLLVLPPSSSTPAAVDGNGEADYCDAEEEDFEEPQRRVPNVLMDDNLMELTRGRPFPLKHRAKVGGKLFATIVRDVL